MRNYSKYLFAYFLLLFAWSNPAFADDYFATNSVSVTDSSGNKVVVWTANDETTGSLAIRGNTYTVANGWSGPFVISDDVSAYSISNAQLAIDSSGNVVVAWLSYIAATDDYVITAASFEHVTSGYWGALSSLQGVSSTADYAQSDFKLYSAPNDSFTITWSSLIGKGVDSRIQVGTISTYDGTWPSPTTVSDT